MTEETKRKIGEANKGKMPWNFARFHSPETIIKIKEARQKYLAIKKKV